MADLYDSSFTANDLFFGRQRDVITATERQQIDEFIAKNGVNTCHDNKPKKYNPWIARRRRKIAG